MTCIVGVEDRGIVYIGGDSALTDSDTGSLSILKDPKVFVRGNTVIGCCSSMRILQLIGHSFDPPTPSDEGDDVQYMVVTFIDALKAFLKKKGSLKQEGDVETQEAQHLVGFKGSLYYVDSDFQAHRVTNGWAAVGSGADVALGSMHTTAKLGMRSRDRILAALRAAEAHNAHVRRPFHIVRFPPGEKR